MSDHVHMMLAIPPKYAVSQVVGYLVMESAQHRLRDYDRTRRQSMSGF